MRVASTPSLDTDARTVRRLRRRSLLNLLLMGHRAPTVMQTVLDVSGGEARWLVMLTAGVMALGLVRGEIENSRLRVLRMIGTMAIGGDAFVDDLNAFNRTMNLGHRLARWFEAEVGITRCRAITQYDFSTAEGVRRYIDRDGTGPCGAIARSVAQKVRELV